MSKKAGVVAVSDDEEFFDMFSGLPAQDPFDIKKDHFAAELAALMIHAGKSRSEMAEKLGWSKSRITNVLSGKCNLTVRSIYEWSASLGFDIDINFHLPSESSASQPWEKGDGVVISGIKATGFSMNVQTAAQVAKDFSNGAERSHYVSFSAVSPVVSRLRAPLISNRNASTTNYLPAMWINAIEPTGYDVKDVL